MAKNDKLAKRGSTGITKWDEELAKHAADVSAAEQMPTGSFVSTRGGILAIAGQPLKDNKMQVIIVDHVYENAFYEGDYDADNPSPPSCYAFGRTEEELKPHEKASDPVHDQCTGCPNNAFGSAEKGKGKACKNIRRLALISADGLSKESIKDGERVYLKVPVTSAKGWAFFVKGLASTMKRPPFAVIAEIAAVPDPKSQFRLTFQHVENVPDALMGAVMARREKEMSEIMFPYAAPAEDAKPAKGKGGKKGGKEAKAAPKTRKF